MFQTAILRVIPTENKGLSKKKAPGEQFPGAFQMDTNRTLKTERETGSNRVTNYKLNLFAILVATKAVRVVAAAGKISDIGLPAY
jgi:hypothetical protein